MLSASLVCLRGTYPDVTQVLQCLCYSRGKKVSASEFQFQCQPSLRLFWINKPRRLPLAHTKILTPDTVFKYEVKYLNIPRLVRYLSMAKCTLQHDQKKLRDSLAALLLLSRTLAIFCLRRSCCNHNLYQNIAIYCQLSFFLPMQQNPFPIC